MKMRIEWCKTSKKCVYIFLFLSSFLFFFFFFPSFLPLYSSSSSSLSSFPLGIIIQNATFVTQINNQAYDTN